MEFTIVSPTKTFYRLLLYEMRIVNLCELWITLTYNWIFELVFMLQLYMAWSLEQNYPSQIPQHNWVKAGFLYLLILIEKCWRKIYSFKLCNLEFCFHYTTLDTQTNWSMVTLYTWVCVSRRDWSLACWQW